MDHLIWTRYPFLGHVISHEIRHVSCLSLNGSQYHSDLYGENFCRENRNWLVAINKAIYVTIVQTSKGEDFSRENRQYLLAINTATGHSLMARLPRQVVNGN